MVGRIQDFLLASSYAQFGEQPPAVTNGSGDQPTIQDCFTCVEDGSILPFEDEYGNRLAIRDVVVTPTRTHFVHFTEVPPDPSNGGTREIGFDELDEYVLFQDYLRMKAQNKCGLDRAIPAETVYLRKQGEHL
jgi:hypothetical protein